MNVPDFLQTVITQPQIERLGWVLLHSLWQFAVASAFVAAVIHVLRQRSAALRYGVLVAALPLMVGASLVTWSLMLVRQNVPSTALEEIHASRPVSVDLHKFDVAQKLKIPVSEVTADAAPLAPESPTDVTPLAERSVKSSFVVRRSSFVVRRSSFVVRRSLIVDR
jgi:hypothetical protein